MINNFKNTKSYLNNFSQEIVKLLKIEIGRSRKRRSMNPRGRNTNSPIDASKQLRRNISIDPKEEEGKITFNIEALNYVTTVDKGRKAGQKPPPVRDIAKWIKAKPIRLREANGKFVSMNDKKINNLAGVISRSIGFYGTAPTNFISEALEASIGKLDTLGGAVGQDVMDNVEDIFIKSGYIKKGDNYEIKTE
ncbi:MAG: hypothetical protein Tp1102MES256162_43 [Prokaryotic dsDNA virus sp.]|nr:MAG: hypothetical protein Tp1102MES256162_43 [Prokaryotic dsDNA virus sp.]